MLRAEPQQVRPVGLSELGRLDEIDIVVTDSGLTAADRESIVSAGCKLIVAPEPEAVARPA